MQKTLGCRARPGNVRDPVTVTSPRMPAGPNLSRYPVRGCVRLLSGRALCTPPGGGTAARSNHGGGGGGGWGASRLSPVSPLPTCRVHGAPPDVDLFFVRPGAEKSSPVGSARLPQIGGLSVGSTRLKPTPLQSPSAESQQPEYNS